MEQGFSKKNQSSSDAGYRFGDFELNAQNRMLKQRGNEIQLQPKAFDALLCLVRRSQHLVSKQELMNTLWPSLYVSEANLTNVIVSLRKVLGREAIRTVSKHGYRFELRVTGEPGIPPATYERFMRARELTVHRSLGSMGFARDLYWTCLAEDPTFAAAWAWLGRCCWFLAKFSDTPSANLDLAVAAFQRAFVLEPDLATAHQYYTLLQVDTGQADAAMRRLFERLECHPGEPETFASLVQVLRFRGMLEESVQAHKWAVALDPTIVTSVSHTYLLAGEYAAAIESYGGRSAYYLDAAAWAALGEQERAKTVLRERLSSMSLSRLMVALMSSLLALLENKGNRAARLMQGTDTSREPEILVYFARHYAYLGHLDSSIKALRQAANLGFVCPPRTLESDVWLKRLQGHPEFASLKASAKALVRDAKSSFDAYTSNPKIWNFRYQRSETNNKRAHDRQRG